MLIDRAKMEIMVYPSLFPSIWPVLRLGSSAPKFNRRWSSCSGLIHLPMDLPQLPTNLCSLMDAIIPYVHSPEEARGRWQSQDRLDAASSVYLRSLSSVWIGDECSALALVGEACWALWTWAPWEAPPPFISSSTISSFSTLLCLAENWAFLQPSSFSLCLPNPLFHPSPLLWQLHTFLFSPLPSLRPSQSRIQGARHRLSWPCACRSIGPIVYSLHPDTKDIKLTDQWAGARARLINEALGRGEGRGRMDGGRRGRRSGEGGLDR